MRRQRGVTLLEVMVAVSLLGLLSVGVLTAMRLGLSSMGKTNDKLFDNRRIMATQRILQQQLEGFIPAMMWCTAAGEGPRPKLPFFQGEPTAMRLVSTYSLIEAYRGRPQILEFAITPGDQGRGVRLVVNEVPFGGPFGAGALCLGQQLDPRTAKPLARFGPVAISPRSFVLADHLASCSFAYLEPAPLGAPPGTRPTWAPVWRSSRWPLAIRVNLESLPEDLGRLRPTTVTANLQVTKNSEIEYGDF